MTTARSPCSSGGRKLGTGRRDQALRERAQLGGNLADLEVASPSARAPSVSIVSITRTTSCRDSIKFEALDDESLREIDNEKRAAEQHSRPQARVVGGVSLTWSLTLPLIRATVVFMRVSRASTAEGTPHGGNEPNLLREVIRTYQVLMTGFSREIGMPASRLAVLRSLAITDGGAGVMDLARSLGINAAAVTRQIQDLERDRLIQRRSDPKDGRRTRVSLSPKGQKLFEEIHERSHVLEQSLSATIGADEMATVATVLAKLRTFIEGLR